MKTYLINLWDTLRTSFWFVPGAMALAVLLLAAGMLALDGSLAKAGMDYPDWIRTTTEAARSTLSTIVGAMMAVTGTVFSITIVTLSLTSQQFGPRLLRTFMHDLTTQLTLGAFLATGLYCLLVLKFVDGNYQETGVPHFSAALALLLGVAAMIMLIVFFHHISMMIQAPHVVEAVAADLDESIDRLFPHRIGDPPPAGAPPDVDAEKQLAALGNEFLAVVSRREGYIQAIDGDGLLALAIGRDLVVRLNCRPGDFLRREEPLADVWGAGHEADRLVDRINDTVIVGARRTPRQDVECAVDELVEVAVRSLSPGINDPFTAVNCIDRLAAGLARLARRKIPSSWRCDPQGRLRIIARPKRFVDVLDAALNQIRQNGRRSVAVTIRLLEGLEWIARRCPRKDDRAAVLRQAEMTAHNCDAFPEKDDQRRIRERFAAVLTALGACKNSPHAAAD